MNNSHTAAAHITEKDGPQELTAVDLVKKCVRSGEESCWCEFVARFQPVIAGVVAKTVRRYSGANLALEDDLVQSTYLKLCANNYKALRSLNETHENSIYGLLKVIASNVVHDHFRSELCEKRGMGMFDSLNEDIAAGVMRAPYRQDAETGILSWQIEKCLRRYVAGQRDLRVFRLYYGEGFNAREISALAGIGVSTKGVESILHRLTRLLRARLGGTTPALCFRRQ